MPVLIWFGAGLTAAGLALLFYCIRMVMRARRQKDEAKVRQALKKVSPLNLAALGLSGLGLGAVIVGILFG